MFDEKRDIDLVRALKKATLLSHFEIEDILKGFDQYPRFYHSSEHILDLTKKILAGGHTREDERRLLILALFHDFIYDPKATDNERKSAEVFKHDYAPRMFISEYAIKQIYDIILDTKGHVPTSELSEKFCYYDLSGFAQSNVSILENEYKIRKEYAWVDWNQYKEGKLDFLAKYALTPIAKKYREIEGGINWLYGHVANEEAPNIAVYAGSFNPFHIGHKNILEQAERMFDKVIVAQGVNPTKGYVNDADIAHCIESEFNDSHPIDFLNYRQYNIYTTSLIEYINSKGYNPTLVRGLRNTTDLQAEIQQSRWLKALKPDLKIVYIVCDAEFEHISSSGIRAVEMFPDLAELAEGYTVK